MPPVAELAGIPLSAQLATRPLPGGARAAGAAHSKGGQGEAFSGGACCLAYSAEPGG